MLRASIIILAIAGTAWGAPAADLVSQLPGFAQAPFKVYSGYLTVPDYGGPYATLKIHYQFHESQRSPASDPVVTWHQGGPGGSSIYGLFGEMGYFNIDSNGTHTNAYAWNRVSNMLYLESPAGSDDPIGFSYCLEKSGKSANTCSWNDVTQAAAYAHTLKAFFVAFPEHAKSDLYLTGESYAGQYLPNIASYIVKNPSVVSNLKGIAVGNGCWGGDDHTVTCNGPNSEQNDMDMYYGKGLVSKNTYKEVYSKCGWNDGATGMPKNALDTACENAQEKASEEAGPHNVYDIYDNCPNTAEWLRRTGKSMRWLKNYLRSKLGSHAPVAEQNEELLGMSGGYEWGCGQMGAMAAYFKRSDVQKAMHLEAPGKSGFSYDASGPASIVLYPDLVNHIRVLIYNGDADDCVPYKGNEEWTTSMAAQGHVTEKKAWHPWYATKSGRSEGYPPAGYATEYTSSAGLDFSFVTIRLAGHMVPAFQPAPAFSFFSRFLAGTSPAGAGDTAMAMV